MKMWVGITISKKEYRLSFYIVININHHLRKLKNIVNKSRKYKNSKNAIFSYKSSLIWTFKLFVKKSSWLIHVMNLC